MGFRVGLISGEAGELDVLCTIMVIQKLCESLRKAAKTKPHGATTALPKVAQRVRVTKK